MAGPGQLAVEHVEVGAADPAREHPKEQLARSRLRVGQLALAQLTARGFEDHRPHAAERIATLPRFT